METEVIETIGTIIGAIGTIIGAIATVTAVIYAREKKKAQRERARIEEDIAKTDKSGASTFTFLYTLEKLIKIIIIEEDGSGIHRETLSNIKSNQSCENLQIPFRLSAQGGSAFLGEPTVKEIGDSSLAVHVRDKCQFEVPEKDMKVMEGRFLLIGHCGPESEPTSFKWEYPFKGVYLMTREEAEKAYGASEWKQEYAVKRVVVPMEELHVEVRFPGSFKELKTKPSAVCFFGDTEIVHRGEASRIQGDFEFIEGTARLKVSKPFIGLSYGVSWMPPSKD